MAGKKWEIITAKALEILEGAPSGMRFTELTRAIHRELPDQNLNTINGAVWNLDEKFPDKVTKPDRGLFLHAAFAEASAVSVEELEEKERFREQDLYEPFAAWLVEEMEECTKAIPLGGNVFKDKWGTLDVIGVREPRKTDIVPAATEVIAAEIKITSNDLITAFGQACAYKIFSHKSYLVVPSGSLDESRLDALCMIFGLGLVLFDADHAEEPTFEIRTRPQKHDPHPFYVNKYLGMIAKDLF